MAGEEKKKFNFGGVFRAVSAVLPVAIFGWFFWSMYGSIRPPSFPGYRVPYQYAKTKPTKKVALIPIDKAINSLTADAYKSLIMKAEMQGVDGYIFEINSPGGTVLASKELAELVEEISTKKPVIALIRDIGTSGAYWVASACDYIIADETSFVGSIGVRMNYLQFKGLMEKLGIKEEEIKAGEYKTMGSPFKELKEEERTILEKLVMETYELFVKDVAENRGMSVEEVKKLATGQIYSGKQAIENGLIDYLGGREEAAALMAKDLKANFKLKLYYAKQRQSIFGGLAKSIGKEFGKGLIEGLKENKTF